MEKRKLQNGSYRVTDVNGLWKFNDDTKISPCILKDGLPNKAQKKKGCKEERKEKFNLI